MSPLILTFWRATMTTTTRRFSEICVSDLAPNERSSLPWLSREAMHPLQLLSFSDQ